MRLISIANNLNQACTFHMHLVYASKEVLKIRLRCNPSTKIMKPKMLKGGVTLMLDLAYLKSTCIPNFEQLLHASNQRFVSETILT